VLVVRPRNEAPLLSLLYFIPTLLLFFLAPLALFSGLKGLPCSLFAELFARGLCVHPAGPATGRLDMDVLSFPLFWSEC
jgi:hypothetical protein